MQLALAYVPCKDLEEAKKLAKSAIKEKLAVCANILPQIISVYPWEDNIEEENECLLLLKHKNNDFSVLRKKLNSWHSYDVPCIAQIQLSEANESYLTWASKVLIT